MDGELLAIRMGKTSLISWRASEYLQSGQKIRNNYKKEQQGMVLIQIKRWRNS